MQGSRFVAATPALLLFLVAATHWDRHLPSGRGVAVRDRSPSLQGSFTYTPQASDNIEQAVNRGTAGMNFLARPIARSRLRKATQPCHLLTIRYTASQVSIARDNHPPIVTPADGRTVPWKRAGGEALAVNTLWERGKLKETFTSKDGSREDVFSLSPDGQTLTVQVTLRSPRLPSAIVYKLDYRRQAA